MNITNIGHNTFAELPILDYRFNAMPVCEKVFRLEEDNLHEAFNFLTAPTIHSVIMHGFLSDNGLSSRLNRGKFYGYRNSTGEIDGIALIGHSTLFDTKNAAATVAFARHARLSSTPLNMIVADNDQADLFFHTYSGGLFEPRKRCVELAFETQFPFTMLKCPHNVRLAKPEEIDEISEAQAELVFMESGVNPLALDAEGFRRRIMRRIEMGRIYVVIENGKLIFKADVMAATDEAVYLEGIYVRPEERGKGISPACLSTVCIELLRRSSSIHLLCNSDLANAHRSYAKAGFKQTKKYTTLFV